MRVGNLVEHQHRTAGDLGDIGRGQRIGFEIEPLVDGVGASRSSMAPGRTNSGDAVTPSSVRRRAAFSVARNFRILRAGFSSAAFTVCKP